MHIFDWAFMLFWLWIHILAVPLVQSALRLKSLYSIFALHWFAQIVFHRNLNKIMAHHLKAKYGLLVSQKPRSRVSKKARILTKLGGLVGSFLRIGSLFYSSYNGPQPFRLEKLWLPKYALYIVVLDFIFYWSHRFEHQNKFLFKHMHALHHNMQLPNVFSTVYDSIWEKVYNTALLMIMVNTIVPMPFWSLHACYMSLHLVECLGHSGIRAHLTNPNLFFFSLFGMELSVEDHDLHHRKFQGNFGKQTRLWDRVFGTYIPRIET